MADNPPAIQLIDSEPDGYCDPESGVCVLPGAPAATGSGTGSAEDTAPDPAPAKLGDWLA